MTITPIAIGTVTVSSSILLSALTVFAVMTSEQIVVLSIAATTAGTTLIAAVGVVWVNVIMARKVDKVKDEVQEVKAKAEVIVGHVNSEKTAAEGRQTALEVEVRLLRQQLTDKKETAALLAQAAATTPVRPPEPTASLGSPDKPVEMKIVNPESDPANVNQIAKP